MSSQSWRNYSTFESPVSHPPPNAQESAGIFSRMFLFWVKPLMEHAHKQQLHANDVWPLRTAIQADTIVQRFKTPLKQHKNSLPKAFVQVFWFQFLLTGMTMLLSMMCNLVGPVALNRVVTALSDTYGEEETVMVTAAFWVGLVFAAQVVQALADCYTGLQNEVTAIQCICLLKTLLYRKMMKLSASSRKKKSTGELTNMYTADCEVLVRTALAVHQMWLIPLQIVVVSFLLIQVLSIAAFAGIAVIVLMLGLNQLVSKKMYSLQREVRREKDKRMKKVTEAFKAVSIVKLNAWEEPITARISVAREAELHSLLKTRIMTSLSIVLLWGMPVFVCIAAFGTFSVVLHRDLTPTIVFTSLALFLLIQAPLRSITSIVSMAIQCTVALERISSFLRMAELKECNVISVDDPLAGRFIANDVIVAVQDGEFAWEKDGSFVLTNVNLEVKIGEFLVIQGTVGCGKSSLCSALLGEMEKRKGTVYVGGSVAYCSQQAWIQNMSVKDNILFGHPFERKKYKKILDACALKRDLQSLPAGDLTEIGERGVNLSGGQQARIALARACYSNASVYILDSPLSAVDAIVQNEIYQKCLLGLLRNKTIILVTHNPEIISSKYVTRVVTLDEVGTVVETYCADIHSDYEPLVSPMADTLSAFSDSETTTRFSTGDDTGPEDVNRDLTDESALTPPARNSLKSLSKVSLNFSDTSDIERGTLIQDEKRPDGRVSRHVFEAYYHAVGGLPILTAILLLQMLWQALQISSDFWLSSWSNDAATYRKDNTRSNSETTYRLSVYASLGLLAAIMVFGRTVIVTIYGIRAARNLFDRMTHSLMHAPMRFFDANPIGRVLTRYGGDVAAVDIQIPFMFGTLAANVFSVGCSLATAAFLIRWKGFLLLPVIAVYVAVGRFYVSPARELNRLSKTTHAPVLNHLAESVDGISVIRAFGQVDRFFQTSSAKLDANHKIWYAQVYVSQWFSLRIQLVGSLLVLVVTSSLVLLHRQLSVAIIGLVFSYSLKIATNLEGIIRSLTRIETIMVSPERMQEYIDIEQEAPYRIPMMDPPAQIEWPTTGSLVFDKVSFRYKPGGDLVLRNLSFSVNGGQKIGIVGRTGAGKSSLTMALFRINELASGSVLIDGVDVAKIGLKSLREKLSIIPQTPVLFKGPLREYLDPFDEFTDEQLWVSIREVGLGERVAEDKRKLMMIVEENGENFSVGERQMLCMSRALLRHSRVVVFDEATAAIDHETDLKLQQVIRTAFAKSTVLTIAHRLDTVLNSNQILVLDRGRAVEFASPAELVRKGHGQFFELMREGGYLDKFKQVDVKTASIA